MPTKKTPAKTTKTAKGVKTTKKSAPSVTAKSVAPQGEYLQTLAFIFAVLCLVFFAVVVWHYHS